jgi:hypothetical protein
MQFQTARYAGTFLRFSQLERGKTFTRGWARVEKRADFSPYGLEGSGGITTMYADVKSRMRPLGSTKGVKGVQDPSSRSTLIVLAIVIYVLIIALLVPTGFWVAP